MEIKSKPPEVIKSQIAAFSAETVQDDLSRAHILKNLSDIAQNNPESVSRTTIRNEYDADADGKTVKVPPGTEKLIATNEEYLQYLRSVSGSQFESISGRTDMLSAYDQFAPEITPLLKELDDPAKREDHKSLLGKGTNSMVFKISRDGKDYAVRVPRGKNSNPLVIDSHIAGAILGRGQPHLEQIVAASYEDGVTIAEMMPGKEMGNLSVNDIEQISDAQLNEVVDTLIDSSKRGIMIDPKPSNFFYDAEKGFGIVDYSSSKVIDNIEDQQLGSVVGWLATIVGSGGFYGQSNFPETTEDYSAKLPIYKINLGILMRLRSIVERKLQGEDYRIAIERFDVKIASRENTIENYSNPTWVSEQIRANEDFKRIKKEQVASDTPGKIILDIVT